MDSKGYTVRCQTGKSTLTVRLKQFFLNGITKKSVLYLLGRRSCDVIWFLIFQVLQSRSGMDSSCSDVGDGPARLSLSLVSYGSDVEDADAVLDLSNVSEIEASNRSIIPDRSIGLGQSSTTLRFGIPDEEDLILSVAQQMGLSGS